MRQVHVRVLFHESFYDRASSDLVAGRAGARLLVLPVSVGGAPGVTTYEGLLDTIVAQFVSAMGAPGPMVGPMAK